MKKAKMPMANKRKGIKTNPKPKAPHDPKKDDKFGNQTDYANQSKLKIGLTGRK